MPKKNAAQPDQASDSEDESVAEDYSSPNKAAKKRRRTAVPASAKAAKAPKLSSATAKRTERDAAAKVASDDRSCGNRQLSAKAGGILNGSQHPRMSFAALVGRRT